jgi:hypothetical protein
MKPGPSLAFAFLLAAVAGAGNPNLAQQQGEVARLHNSNEQHGLTYLRRSGAEASPITANLSNSFAASPKPPELGRDRTSCFQT